MTHAVIQQGRGPEILPRIVSISSVHFPTPRSSQQLLTPLLLPLRSVVLTVSVDELDQQNRHADGKDVCEQAGGKAINDK